VSFGGRGRSVLGWRTVGIGFAALVLVVGGVVWFRLNTAEAAVGGFLAALARGDAAAALSFAARTPGDTSLLTDVVLAESMKMAPITDIEVAENADHDVVAKYRLGGAPVTATYDTVKVGVVWKLGSVSASLQQWPGGHSPAGSLQVNGVPAANKFLTLFPGSYIVTSPDDRFEVSDGDFTVRDPADTVAINASARSLTDEGVAAFVAAAEAKLSECLEQATVEPEGCGLDDGDLQGGEDWTVEWDKLSADALPEKYVHRALNGSPDYDRANLQFPADQMLQLTFSCRTKAGVRKTDHALVSMVTGVFRESGIDIIVNGW
jgi:hypothetical protein